MDFTPNRNAPASARTTQAAANSAAPGKKDDPTWKASPSWLRGVWVVLLVAAAILLAALIALMLLDRAKLEGGLVDNDKHQAVFLDNGQVYFGKVHSLNERYMDLQGIFYLMVDEPIQPEQQDSQQQGNITLQKLGCELHGPVDQMIINRESISFWENLREDGQVSQAIAEWLKQNPEGLNCEEQANNNNNGGDNSEQEDQNRDENNN